MCVSFDVVKGMGAKRPRRPAETEEALRLG